MSPSDETEWEDIEKNSSGEPSAYDVARWVKHRNDAALLCLRANPPDYEQDPSHSLGAQAERSGFDAAGFAYDRLLENDGRNFLYYPFMNYAEGSRLPSL